MKIKKRWFTSNLLPTTRIYNFEPHTFQQNKDVRKKDLRDKLRVEIEKHHSLENIKDNCKDKRLSIRVCFYLWNRSKQTTRGKKNLDNLLKIFFDSLSEKIDNTTDVHGVGIITNDLNIFEIHADKKLVNNENDEGCLKKSLSLD